MFSLYYTPKEVEDTIKVLYLHLSDDTTQDAAAVKCHIEHALDNLDKRGEMPMEDLKHIFSIVDGCAVQYRCGTVMHFLAHLAKSQSAIYTRCIQAPSHGKAEVDGEGGEIKGTCQRVYDRPALLPEDEKHRTTRLANHKVEDGKIISLAKRMYEILTSSWQKRLLAMNTHQKIKEQRIHLREFGDHVVSLSKMKAVKFAKEDGNKISSCYCF